MVKRNGEFTDLYKAMYEEMTHLMEHLLHPMSGSSLTVTMIRRMFEARELMRRLGEDDIDWDIPLFDKYSYGIMAKRRQQYLQRLGQILAEESMMWWGTEYED